jgi:hypothetical protein
MTIHHIGRLTAFALLLAAGLAQGAGRWNLDGELGVGHDSNAGNAERASDKFSDELAIAGLRADYSTSLSARARLLMRAGLQGEKYNDLEALDNLKLSGLARLTFRTRSNSSANWSLWGSAALWEFDSGLRDSSEYRAGVFLVEPLGTQWSARLSATRSWRRADSAVFDLDNGSLGVDLDWRAGRNLTIYMGSQFRVGDVFSTSTPSPGLLSASEARAIDDAFGGGRVVYRLDADTWVHTLGFNVGLRPGVALDVQAQYVDADATGANEYRRWTTIGSLLARF